MGERNSPKTMLEGVKQAGRSEVLGPFQVNPAPPPAAPFIPLIVPPNFPTDVTIVNVEADDSLGEMMTVYLEATEENGPDIAQIIIPPDPTLVPYQPYIFAKLEWGMDGYQAQAEVDFVRGMAFSVTGSYIRVMASLDRDAFIGVTPHAFTPVRCAAFVSRGTHPTFPAPTRTLFFPAVPSLGDSAIRQIPRFARSVSLMIPTTAFPVPNHRIEILNANSVITSVGFAAGINGAQDVKDVELPLDARLIRIHNADPALPLTFRAVFRLAL